MRWMRLLVGCAIALALVSVLVPRDRPNAIELESVGGSTGANPDEGGAPKDLPAHRVDAAEGDASARSSASPTSSRQVQVEGTLVVLDERGVEHEGESGRLLLAFWDGSRAYRKEVSVERGRFLLLLSEAEAAQGVGQSGGAVLGERRASLVFPAGETRHRIQAGNPRLDLRARWHPRTLLHVRDARDGRALTPVLVASIEPFDEALEHPGGAAAKAREFDEAPLVLPSGERDALGRSKVFARSPGFAWARVDFDPMTFGERFLELVPSGDIDLRVEGEFSNARARLRLRRASGDFVAGFELPRSRALAIDGLEPGEYTLRVELGTWYAEPHVLCTLGVEVVAGERASAVLRLDAAPPSPRVPFAGTIHLPIEWGLTDFELAFEREGLDLAGRPVRFGLRRETMQPSSFARDLLHWTAPDSPPGTYSVELGALGFASSLDLPEPGTTTAAIDVPPPCEVSVMCLDAGSGRRIVDIDLHWSAESPLGVRCRTRAARWEAETERWRFRAPVGQVQLFPYNQLGYDPAPSSHTLHAGRNELVLRLQQGCELVPLLRDGATELVWPEGWEQLPVLEPLEGQQAARTLRTLGGPPVLLSSREPGLFLLKVPAQPGYEPVPDTPVHLERGKRIEHVIELRRSPR